MIHTRFATQIQSFAKYARLQSRLQVVLTALPAEIQQDFIDDATFHITLEDFTPGKGWKLFMACPTLGNPVTRCVVLRHKLNNAPEAFVDYVIAHEFAHAYLRNGGWGDITDKEEAADALAASWGFSRPREIVWWR